MIKKLVKTESTYHLVVNDKIIASVGDSDGKLQKLSLKNCQEIENGYDLDELAVLSTKEETTIVGNQKMAQGFIKGFQKALEILGDKKFSEEDVKKTLYLKNGFDKDGFSFYKSDEEIIQSLQQTEWDVEIITEPFFSVGDNFHDKYQTRPKLDADGCLILKRK